MSGHGPGCQCYRCVQEGIEADDAQDRAEQHAADADQERADRGLAAAEARTMNYPDGWADTPW